MNAKSSVETGGSGTNFPHRAAQRTSAPARRVRKMNRRDEVEIEAFGPEGNLVLCLLFSGYEWYEHQHSVIDNPEERVRRNVAEIRGKQYDAAGALSQRWRCTYAADGSLTESWQWQADGTLQHRKWHPDGLVEEVDP